jgi:beta-carotene 3-hydroxylase
MIQVILLLVAFCAMEFVAWFTHKYVMHGPLWYFHRDHHTRDNKGFFEKNDFFFLLFAIPGMICIFLGWQMGSESVLLWIGLGITMYGLTYFLVHDIFIHQRFKLFRNTDNRYFRAIRRAHKVHHKHLTKEDGECFGMLVVPLKYLRGLKQQKEPGRA